MPVLTTGPIENSPSNGVRPSQEVTAKFSNRDQVNPSSVQVTGTQLNGTQTIYVEELFVVPPNGVVTRNYYADLNGYEFVFDITGAGAEQTEVSVWGKSSGNLVAAQRLVLSELLSE